ncbi:cell envelope integrity protein CreD [Thetidibacter halocola]|uniref:Cell envelope integrity protein CreD n=1 Tax=Thetidibacter halocola TaxID=2827239 RepID=A0A8J7WIU3_9RHOB|nr:cell envelope integrity protein CreD [Thetidibacter halocola]MBS0126411.1 cell envelope integrity protein CreD [Thetidibacter halocola]
MRASAGRRFLVVGLLVLLMFVPLFFAAEVIDSRKSYSQSTIDSVGEEWGGPQVLAGPQLVIPVERTVTRLATRPRLDPATGAVLTDAQGNEVVDRFEETVRQLAAPIHLYPDRFEADVQTATQIRSRGIFTVPVYTAEAEIRFDFDTVLVDRVLAEDETILWDRAEIRMAVGANRALRGAAEVTADGRALELAPLTGEAGFLARLGDPRGIDAYTLALGFNGAQSLMLAPVGRDSRVTLSGDWPHPSFTGAFLPDGSTVTKDGYEATWTIPHLARALPQAAREDPQAMAQRMTAFGLRFVEANDFYHKAFRAARYGILFIALTFLTVVLMERSSGQPVHPVQYILIGLVQTVFVLLMVAYAEHLGWGPAYLIASGATIALLTAYGAFGLKLGRRALVLGAMLVSVYAVLYMILQSADYALLAGSTLAFLALALTMWVTRDEDWFGPERPRREGAWSRLLGGSGPPPPPDTPA